MNEKQTKQEQKKKEILIDKCWSFLDANFHKFSEANQIKIALELCKKDIPQEMTGQFTVTQMGNIEKGGQSMVFNIGQSVGADG